MSNQKALVLRDKYPIFAFTSFKWTLDGNHDFTATFTYQLQDDLTLTHEVIFRQVDPALLAAQDRQLIDALVFHLGLIEAFSYWKLTVSPTFEIRCAALSDEQTAYWQKWLLNGMGEFFYVNQIDFTTPNFVTIDSSGDPLPAPSYAIKQHAHRRTAVNIGGGKDSAVMLSMMEKSHEDFVNLIIHPSSPATEKMANLTGRKTHHVTRQFDPQLLSLNASGDYFNGHVPFSASVAFINLLAGVLYSFDFCMVGNESSSNEPTLTWHDQPINHQYSKSIDFEESFIEYCKLFLIKNVRYFSFLRVFNELQIAHIFSTAPKYFPLTKSCNRHQQKNSWCQECAKCLFVYLTLAPYIDEEVLTTQIFDHNLLTDKKLAPIFCQLAGLTPVKPLECVGTREEVGVAVYLLTQKYLKDQHSLPLLLDQYGRDVLISRSDWPQVAQRLAIAFNSRNTLPNWALRLASDTFSEITIQQM